MRLYVLYNDTDGRFHCARPFYQKAAAKARATITSKAQDKKFSVVEVLLDPYPGAAEDYPYFAALAQRVEPND